MSSLSIPSSKAGPDINSPHTICSSESVRSALSTGSLITAWRKKLVTSIARQTKNQYLTEESLNEFNRTNALTEARSSTISPYYKGLTDFSLAINRERLSGSSPGRESHAMSFISSDSKSSFVVKMQEWGTSCFTSKKHERSISSSGSFRTKSSHHTHNQTSAPSWTKSSNSTSYKTSSSSSLSEIRKARVMIKNTRGKATKNDSKSERMKVTFPSVKSEDIVKLSTNEKPLREKEAESPYCMLPLAPPTAQPPEDVPYPLPQIIPPTAQALSSPLPTLVSHTQTPPAQESFPSPPPPSTRQASPSRPPDVVGVIHQNEIKTTENETKYVWADRYRPLLLQDFLCNRTTALWLQSIVRNWHNKAEECGHFIFEGNPGVGKRTMIWALLREAFGPDKVQAREECKEFYLKGEPVASILVNLVVSTQHIEVNLSELKGYEKHIIAELIKGKNQILSAKTLRCNQENCKAIILYEADKLSTDALTYIKWMLEKFKGCNKVFFCCNDISKLQLLKPLCRVVQLNEPSNEEIIKVLAFIGKQERIQLPHQLAHKIANSSKNNLRQAIRSFEATWHFNYSLNEDQDIKTGWEDKIAKVARNLIEEQSPKQLYIIRGELQKLIEHNVALEFICKTLMEELKKKLPEKLQLQVDNLSDKCHKNNCVQKYLASAHIQQEELGKRLTDPKKDIQYLMMIEEFIARLMSWYKDVIENKEV